MSATPVEKRAREDDAAGGAAVDAATKRQCRRETKVRVSKILMPGVTNITCVLASGDGELFLGTRTALYMKTNKRVTLIAGHNSEKGFKDGQSFEARFREISGLALMPDGGIMLVDKYNHSVRFVSPDGEVRTVAGTMEKGFVDDCTGHDARFNEPHGIVVINELLLFVSDSSNHCIRRLYKMSNEEVRWSVSTVFGKGQEKGYVNGLAREARLNCPAGLALNREKDLIIADKCNDCVRKFRMSAGRVGTVAGPLEDAEEGLALNLQRPSNVAVDGNNSIFVVEDLDWTTCGLFQISEENGTFWEIFNESGDDISCSPHGMSIDKKGRLILCSDDEDDYLKYPLLVAHARLVAPFPRHTTNEAPRSLQNDYAALLADQSLMDATFAVDGGVFRAHRVILGARSSYFRELFQANAATDAHIAITNISGPVFQILLQYVYTGQYPPMTEYTKGVSVLDVACAAKTLDVQGLYQNCLETFEEMLTMKNVLIDIIGAHKKGLSDFEDVGMKFISQDISDFSWAVWKHKCLVEFEGHPDLLGLLLQVTTKLLDYITDL